MLRTRVLSFIGWALISLWSKTLRVSYVRREIPERLVKEGTNFIFAFWHGRQFFLLETHKRYPIVIPASESRDGEIQAGILDRFGFEVVRGSSKRKGAQALLGLVDGLRRGKHIALAVDGPRGPVYEVKQGVTYLSGKLNKPIVPIITGAKRHWILSRIWDKYLLPAPFTRAVVVYGEPIMARDTSEPELEAKRLELQQALNGIMKEADEFFRKGRS